MLAATIVGLVIAIGGCGGGHNRTSPLPSTGPTTIRTSSAPHASGPTAWKQQYTRSELRQYHDALAQWRKYSRAVNQIYREGAYTPAASALFKKYTAIASYLTSDLRQSQQDGIRTIRPPKPLWWKPAMIKPGVVIITECDDFTHALVTQHGKTLKSAIPDHKKTPFTIHMSMPSGRGWLLYSAGGSDERSCA